MQNSSFTLRFPRVSLVLFCFVTIRFVPFSELSTTFWSQVLAVEGESGVANDEADIDLDANDIDDDDNDLDANDIDDDDDDDKCGE